MQKYPSWIPYYHPVNQWLLGATNGIPGQTLMCIWVLRPQNIPLTSNSLLSPTKSICQTKYKPKSSLKLQIARSQPKVCLELQISPNYQPLNQWLLGVTSGNQDQWWNFKVSRQWTTHNRYKSKYPQTPNSLLPALKQWLLGATNGIQGQTLICIWSSKNINHQ